MTSRSLRRYWDAAVMALILASAFEVPYNLAIGWDDNPHIGECWTWAYIVVFGLDILVHIIQGDTAAHFHDDAPMDLPQPARALHYLKSKWFWIDLLAWVPLDILLSQLGGHQVVRTLRLTRSLHLLHAFKGLRAIEALKRQLSRHPAFGRFVLLSFLVPWLIHMHTVVLAWAEKDQPGSELATYTEAGHHVLVTLLTQDPFPNPSAIGYGVWVSTAVLALVVVATVIGNAASLLMGIDARAADLENRLSDWHRVFRAYPQVFTNRLQGLIIRHEQSRAEEYRRNISGQAQLIESLPGEIEDEVIDRLRLRANPSGNSPSAQLLKLLSGPQA